ncbi:MAG: hypothetical protein K2Y39_10055 [Candidatus Obscuribacterales bacterium]|nr:hypothetical protein [Candidatus Obscuribacterales bacterium]
MSVRTRTFAVAVILATSLCQSAAIAQMGNQLTAEEQVAAQNFNGIDIVGDSFGTPASPNSSNTTGQNFSTSTNGSFNRNIVQNGFSTNLNNQNTQLGQTNAFSLNNCYSNGINSMTDMNGASGMSGASGMNTTNNMNNGMPNTLNNGMNNGLQQNIGMMQNSGINNGSAGNGDIVQSIGNTIMNDPKMMQRAVGVAGAAALFGLFVTNGGVGGMMRSAGMDTTRHIRGPGGGY